MKKYLEFLLAFFIVMPLSAQPLLVAEHETADGETAAENLDVDDENMEMLSGIEPENKTAENLGGNLKNDENQQQKKQKEPESVPESEPESAPESEPESESEPEPEPIEYLTDPSNFSADFMVSLYQCQPNKEQQNLAGREEVVIAGKINGRCRLIYDDFMLSVPMELLANIHSMTDIRHLLQNPDIMSYQPKYEYSGLLQELNVCSRYAEGHNAYLHRRTLNEVTITKGLISKVENGGCTIRLLNQLNLGEKFADYSVICKIPASDMEIILGAYTDLLTEHNPENSELQKADDEIMFRLQQIGYCKKPKL
ncbi:MAG: hypothetical protein MSB80_07280 [Alphaproteobacteria bacterium]|nr:hypothetical protein [Alphaproteobacteria bacterium]